MTVIAMSRTEIDRMSVLHDLADGRIRIAEASALMGLGRRQVFRLAKAFSQHGPQALVSRRRGRPSNRCYPTALRAEVIGIIWERYADFGPTLSNRTPLRIPYGNKEVALKLGARYGSEGWYAPPGVDLSAFGKRGWL
jgi:hypothetical protein